MSTEKRTPSLLPVLLALPLLLLGAATASAQSLKRAVPEVASPGDLVILEGSNLGSVTTVRFTAVVGGFVGQLSIDVPATVVSPTKIETTCPMFNAFVPPGAVAPSSPFGTVSLTVGGFFPASLDFFFCEGTFGQTVTVGNGTTQSTGMGRPVVSFDLAGGQPMAGNANFVLKLENAVPGAPAFFAVGDPATPPFQMFGDGTLVVDLNDPGLLMFGPFTVDSTGEVSVPAAIPAGASGTFMIQWAVVDASFGLTQFALSNGLQTVL